MNQHSKGVFILKNSISNRCLPYPRSVRVTTNVIHRCIGHLRDRVVSRNDFVLARREAPRPGFYVYGGDPSENGKRPGRPAEPSESGIGHRASGRQLYSCFGPRTTVFRPSAVTDPNPP